MQRKRSFQKGGMFSSIVDDQWVRKWCCYLFILDGQRPLAMADSRRSSQQGHTLLFCMFVFNSRLERFYRHCCIYKCAGPCNHEWISTSSFHQWANRRYFHFHFCIDFHLFNYRRLSWHPSICLSFCLPVCLYKILCIKTSIRLIVDQTLVFINKHIDSVYAALLVSIKKDYSLNWNTFLCGSEYKLCFKVKENQLLLLQWTWVSLESIKMPECLT